MVKLLSLNMEGERHLDLVQACIQNENPDVVCLIEAPEFFADTLTTLGFSSAFAPMIGRHRSDLVFQEGILIASRLPFTFQHEYYYKMAEEIAFCSHGETEVISFPMCLASVEAAKGTFTIGALHLPVTAHGQTDAQQTTAVHSLLSILDTQPPHILCGDFNMPRGYNDLYPLFRMRYQDAIPPEYTSSLDRHIHRLGRDPNLTDPIFDEFMVDYIFTQSPYVATDVRLEFGISDHAAVIGYIEKQT